MLSATIKIYFAPAQEVSSKWQKKIKKDWNYCNHNLKCSTKESDTSANVINNVFRV